MRRLSRFLSPLMLLLVMAPLVYLGIIYALDSQLYPGDEKVSRTCRRCDGDGCRYCEHDGRVDVIVPGEVRPTRVWGLVVDTEAVDNPAAYRPRQMRGSTLGEALLPDVLNEFFEIDGAIAGAVVTFRSADGEEYTTTTSSSGRFSQRLPPGRYRVRMEAEGFRPYRPRKKLVIHRHRADIWLEDFSQIERVEELSGVTLTSEEARATNGLNFAAGLRGRKSARMAFYKTWVAR